MSNQIEGMAVTSLEGTDSYSLQPSYQYLKTSYKSILKTSYGIDVIGEMDVGNFIASSGVWVAYPLPIYRIYDDDGILGEAGCYSEQQYAIAALRTKGKKISFDYKINSTAHNTVDPESGAMEVVLTGLSVIPALVTADNRIMLPDISSLPEGSYVSLVCSAAIATDWIAGELDLSSLPAPSAGTAWGAVMLLALYQSSRKGYDEPWYNFADDIIQIRNIRVSPPEIILWSPKIGAQESLIATASELSLAAQTLTSFVGRFNHVSGAALSLSGAGIKSGVTKTIMSDPAGISLSRYNPSYVWQIPRAESAGAKLIYTMTLSADGYDDIDIPISSFQSVVRQGGATIAELEGAETDYNDQLADLAERIAAGGYTSAEIAELEAQLLQDYQARVSDLSTSRPSYLSCVIPNYVDYIDDILLRQDGEVIIKKGYEYADGRRNLEEIIRANFEYMTCDQGARSASAQITSYKVKSYNSPKRRVVSDVSFTGVDSSGRRRIRAAVDLFLRPQDVCVYGAGANDYMNVGTITYVVNEKSATMTVTEQDETFEA